MFSSAYRKSVFYPERSLSHSRSHIVSLYLHGMFSGVVPQSILTFPPPIIKLYTYYVCRYCIG